MVANIDPGKASTSLEGIQGVILYINVKIKIIIKRARIYLSKFHIYISSKDKLNHKLSFISNKFPSTNKKSENMIKKDNIIVDKIEIT